LDWIGFDWIGLDSIRFDSIRLDYSLTDHPDTHTLSQSNLGGLEKNLGRLGRLTLLSLA